MTRLHHGNFRFVIADKSNRDNFMLRQLSGGSVWRQLTSRRFVGTKSVQLELLPGKYTYYSGPHKKSMRGLFTLE